MEKAHASGTGTSLFPSGAASLPADSGVLSNPKANLPGRGYRLAGIGRQTLFPRKVIGASPDQFFTKESVAADCLRMLRQRLDLDPETHFIEPSAGDGAFFSLLPEGRRTGLDLHPRAPGIERADFLAWRTERAGPVVVVGNPPFGKRGRTAVDFVIRSLSFAETVGMILPMTFTRHEGQKRVPKGVRLVCSVPLPPASFVLPNGEPYSVRAVFQVWTWRPGSLDLRVPGRLPTRHSDFAMWQYNNTPAALRHFNEPFEFAVPCQGWQDYSRRETEAGACEKSKQWMLLRPRTARARKVLFHDLDYHALAHEAQTAVPGFRKGTLVQAYEAAAC